MGDECKDCVQVKGLEDKIKALWHQVDESKGQRKDHEKRRNVGSNACVRNEQACGAI